MRGHPGGGRARGTSIPASDPREEFLLVLISVQPFSPHDTSSRPPDGSATQLYSIHQGTDGFLRGYSTSGRYRGDFVEVPAAGLIMRGSPGEEPGRIPRAIGRYPPDLLASRLVPDDPCQAPPR